jgi:hypothetical protein
MTCLYGSQKQEDAQEFINPNDIGVLCALFGIQGTLCRLLDLVPQTIKKIASLNPDINNADDVFKDILKKVAKKSFGLVVDELTGQITTESFCSIPAPTLPTDITYEDIFSFIAELVPILNYLITANEVLQGNSTTLLDKIVGFWLYKKWSENCECKRPKPDEPDPPPDLMPLLGENIGCADIPPSQTQEINDFISGLNAYTARLASAISNNNQIALSNFNSDIETNIARLISAGYVLSNFEIKEEPFQNITEFYTAKGFGCQVVTIYNTRWLNPKVSAIITIRGQDGSIVLGDENTVHVLALYRRGIVHKFTYRLDNSACNCPPEIVPPSFCELFPLDPLCFTETPGCTDPLAVNYDSLANTDDGSCIYTDDENPFPGCTDPLAVNYDSLANTDDGSCIYCELAYVDVVEFVACGKERATKTVEYFEAGPVLTVDVVEFVACGKERATKTVEYFECD